MVRIILDTDPGIDDALALFLALASPELHIEALTTVSGNVHVADTTRNALALLEVAGYTHIPVARGCEEPLCRKLMTSDDVHGKNGLGGVILPEPSISPVSQHAVDLIIEKVMSAPGEITLVAIGPLTNLALALRHEPRLAQAVREVVIMGGALRVPGNMTPCAEFNIYCDPHAAHIVFKGGWPIRLVPLDVTKKAILPRSAIQHLVMSNTPVMALIKQMLDYYFDTFGGADPKIDFHMHDPLCLAAVFRPDFLVWEEAYVEVEVTGTLTLGETVSFFARPGKRVIYPPNMRAAVNVDEEGFNQLYLERVKTVFSH